MKTTRIAKYIKWLRINKQRTNNYIKVLRPFQKELRRNLEQIEIIIKKNKLKQELGIVENIQDQVTLENNLLLNLNTVNLDIAYTIAEREYIKDELSNIPLG